MLVNVKVAIALQIEIEGAVAGEQLQHVIEEANAGRNLVSTLALDRQGDGDARFGSVALESRAAHCCAGFEV
jgi:hypothetical protein